MKEEKWQAQPPSFLQHPNHIGYHKHLPVYDPSGPAPPVDKYYVKLASGNIRRITPSEILKMKGLPTNWHLPPKAVATMSQRPGTAEWSVVGEYLGHLLAGTLPPRTSMDNATETVENHTMDFQTHGNPELETPSPAAVPTWTWTAPNLSVESDFYHAQLKRLKEVVALCQGSSDWIEEGISIMARHRTNYGPDGPKSLVVLW